MPAANSPPTRVRILQPLLLALSIVAFLFALILPVARLSGPMFFNQPIHGFELFAYSELLANVAALSWGANSLLLIAWICVFCRRPRASLACSLVAAGLAMATPFMFEFDSLAWGFTLWLASILLAGTTALTALLRPQRLPARGMSQQLKRLGLTGLTSLLRPRRLWLPRFSLRTMLLLMLLMSIPLTLFGMFWRDYRRTVQQNADVFAFHTINDISQKPRAYIVDFPPPFDEQRLVLVNGKDLDLRHLARFKSLESLELRSRNFTEACVAQVPNLPSIRRLVLSFPQMSPATLQALPAFPQLEELTLANAERIDDAALAPLAQHTSLRRIKLVNCAVDGSGLRGLSGLHQLELLSIRGDTTTDCGRLDWPALPRLQSLELDGKQFSDNTLHGLSSLTSLEELHLGYARNRPEKPNRKYTADGFRALRHLPNLRVLDLPEIAIFSDCLPAIAELPALESLAIQIVDFDHAALAPVAAMPQLTSLSLVTKQLDIAQLEQLTDCAALRGLEIDRVEDQHLPALGKLTQLEQLRIRGTFTDDGLKQMKFPPQLKQLHLLGNYTNASVAMVGELTELEELKLGGASYHWRSLTDACLADLHELNKLQQLDFLYTRVTGPGVIEYKKPHSPQLSITRRN